MDGAQSQRSSDDSTRTFLNMFAYEAKAAFYLCYANAWIDLIPWLKEQRGLDLVSERFLRFWQYQNQPSTGQDGRIRRDVFSGQVLALHPLSGFFMKDEALCAVAGRFFASSEHDTIMQTGKADDDPTYWDFVGALLDAAQQYRMARDQLANRQGASRNIRTLNEEVAEVAAKTEGSSNALLLEDFAEHMRVRCACGGRLQFVKFHDASEQSQEFRVDYVCTSCKRTVSKQFNRDALMSWMELGKSEIPRPH